MINEDGGIDGRTVDLHVIDSAGDPVTGVTNLQSYLTSNDKPDAVYAGAISAEALPLIPILTQQEIFTVTMASSPQVNQPDEYPFAFTSGLAAFAVNDALATHLAEAGHTKIAYAALDDESGHAAVDAFSSVAEEKGLTVVPGYLPSSSLDATSTLDALRAESPDALAFNANGPAIGSILKARTNLQWDIPAYGDGTVGSYNLGMMSGPEDWDNLFIQTPAFAAAGTELAESNAVQNYLSSFKEQAGEISTGFVTIVSPLNAVLMVKAAYEASESDDPAALAENLVNVASDGVPESIA